MPAHQPLPHALDGSTAAHSDQHEQHGVFDRDRAALPEVSTQVGLLREGPVTLHKGLLGQGSKIGVRFFLRASRSQISCQFLLGLGSARGPQWLAP